MDRRTAWNVLYLQKYGVSLRELDGAAGLDVLHDLFVGEALVWDVTERDYLVQNHAVAPDVRLVREQKRKIN